MMLSFSSQKVPAGCKSALHAASQNSMWYIDVLLKFVMSNFSGQEVPAGCKSTLDAASQKSNVIYQCFMEIGIKCSST